MDQFREELMTPNCQLIGECRYHLLRRTASVLCAILLATWRFDCQAHRSDDCFNVTDFRPD
jgi:hypothetical protein